MRWRDVIVVFLLSCAGLYWVHAQPVDPELTNLSSTINAKLLNLKQEIGTLNDSLLYTTAQLCTLSESYKMSLNEQEEWKARSMSLSASLTSISEELTNSHELITKYKAQVATRGKIVLVLLIVLVIRVVGMITGYILYAKGIKLPRWIDILL
jgi:uncharacterized phage infection (PIP) family protein YhgE